MLGDEREAEQPAYGTGQDSRVPALVVVSGQPGSGKTTLGRQLAADLRLPFVNKDGIKEQLYYTLGWGGKEWSQKLGRATYAVLYYVIETQLAAGRSVLAESNFDPPTAREELRRLQERYDCRFVEVHCVAGPEVLWQRFQERDLRGERHPGHVDERRYKDVENRLRFGAQEPLGLGEVVTVDASDFGHVDYQAIREQVVGLL